MVSAQRNESRNPAGGIETIPLQIPPPHRFRLGTEPALHFVFLLHALGGGLWNLLPGPISVRATALGGGRDVVHPGFFSGFQHLGDM